MTCINMIHENEIYTYKTKHEFAKKYLWHNLPFLLNNIPTIAKEKLNTHSLQGFAKYVKLYLFTKLSRFMHKTKFIYMYTTLKKKTTCHPYT